MGLGEMMANLFGPDRAAARILTLESKAMHLQELARVADDAADRWKAAALLLATSSGYSHPRLCIRYAGMLADAENEIVIRQEFDHHWAKCSPAERATVRLVCGGLGVAVPQPEAVAVPGNLGYWEAVT
jgi:hypothetical protein